MDNAQKAIMIGVGLFITIIVIAAVMLITGIGQDLLNSGTNQLTGISESLRTQMAEEYDGKTFTTTQLKASCYDLVNRNDVSVQVKLVHNYVVNAGALKKETSSKTITFSKSSKAAASGIVTQTIAATNSNITTVLNNFESTHKWDSSVNYDSTNTGIITVTFTAK